MLAVLFATGLSAAKAEAVPITGAIGFAGGISPVADWNTVNVIDIMANQALVLCNVVTPCMGAFTVFNGGGFVATYNDIQIAPLVVVNPQWAVGGFSFNLAAITSVTRAPIGIVIGGTGTLFGPVGFDPTPALWSFSADETDQVFRFSSTTAAVATAVPDGGATILLLGAALFGLGAVRRKMQS
jgi:hypothetical protein